MDKPVYIRSFSSAYLCQEIAGAKRSVVIGFVVDFVKKYQFIRGNIYDTLDDILLYSC